MVYVIFDYVLKLHCTQEDTIVNLECVDKVIIPSIPSWTIFVFFGSTTLFYSFLFAIKK